MSERWGKTTAILQSIVFIRRFEYLKRRVIFVFHSCSCFPAEIGHPADEVSGEPRLPQRAGRTGGAEAADEADAEADREGPVREGNNDNHHYHLLSKYNKSPKSSCLNVSNCSKMQINVTVSDF